MLESPYKNHFDGSRVLVIMEVRSLSDTYNQIMLTKEQRNKVLDLLESFMPHESPTSFLVTTEDEDIVVKDARDEFSAEEIKKEQEKYHANY